MSQASLEDIDDDSDHRNAIFSQFVEENSELRTKVSEFRTNNVKLCKDIEYLTDQNRQIYNFIVQASEMQGYLHVIKIKQFEDDEGPELDYKTWLLENCKGYMVLEGGYVCLTDKKEATLFKLFYG